MKCVPCLPAKLRQSSLFSCFVAVCLFVVVLVIGGKILSEFEGGDEDRIAKQVQVDKDLIQAMATRCLGNAEDRANFTQAYNRLVGWADSKQAAPNIKALNWNFKGGVFFMFTTMTTIGYGSFVPYTDNGRAAVIWFGSIGLVISVVTTAILGANLSKLVDRMMQACKCKEGLVWKKSLILAVSTVCWWLIFGAIYAQNLDDDSYFHGFYYAFVTFTSIGFGDLVIDYQDSGVLVWWTITVMIGLVFFAAAFECMTDPLTEMLEQETEPSTETPAAELSEQGKDKYAETDGLAPAEGSSAVVVDLDACK